MSDAILTIDVGGTKTMATVYDLDMNSILRNRVLSDVSSQRKEIKIIEELITSTMSQTNNEIVAIGIDSVGQIDSETGIWYGINKQIKETINLSDTINEKFDIPVYVMNDVYAATYAELKAGIGQRTKDFIYLNIGTGIAGRQVEDGHIINGSHQYAGEFGHIIVDCSSKIKCSCGRFGCVESFASGLGMSNEAKRFIENNVRTSLEIDDNGRVPVQELMEMYPSDNIAKKVIDNAVNGLSALINNLIRSNDPDVIVLGGGVVNSDELFNYISNSLNFDSMDNVYDMVRTGLNPNLIASLGAAHFVKDHL